MPAMDQILTYMRELAWYQAENLHRAEKRIKEKIVSEVSESLETVVAQLKKAKTEVAAKIESQTQKISDLETALANANVTDPAVLQAVSDLKAEAQSLDDIVPDEPVEETPAPVEGEGF